MVAPLMVGFIVCETIIAATVHRRNVGLGRMEETSLC